MVDLKVQAKTMSNIIYMPGGKEDQRQFESY